MSNHWKAVFGVILIFIFGCLSGMLCTSLYLRHKAFDFMQRGPEAVTQLLEHRMTGNLNLDANQKEQIHDIILENLQQRKQLQREIQPRVQMANRQTLMEINAVLRPDQQQLFHENIAEFKKRFGRNPFNPNAESPSEPAAQPGVGGTNAGVGARPATGP